MATRMPLIYKIVFPSISTFETPPAIVHQFMAYRKEQIAIAALTIRKETQIMGLSRYLVQ